MRRPLTASAMAVSITSARPNMRTRASKPPIADATGVGAQDAPDVVVLALPFHFPKALRQRELQRGKCG